MTVVTILVESTEDLKRWESPPSPAWIPLCAQDTLMSLTTVSAISCHLPLAMAEEARIASLTGCLMFSLGGHTSTCAHSYPASLCYPYLFYQQPWPLFSLNFQGLLLWALCSPLGWQLYLSWAPSWGRPGAFPTLLNTPWMTNPDFSVWVIGSIE